MIYLFKRGPEGNAGIEVINVKSASELKKEVQKYSLYIIFIYNDSESSIEVLNDYYDAIECTYFIYKHLGIFKPLSDISINYSLKV